MNTNYETGASNHKVNDIVLTVINDGNGSQCGMTYSERCELNYLALLNACRYYAPTAKNADINEAGKLIRDYYIQHTSTL